MHAGTGASSTSVGLPPCSWLDNHSRSHTWSPGIPFILNKAIGIINFAKHFLNFIDDTMIWYLSSKLNLNLFCVKVFWNLNSMMTWCINWRRLLALIIFQRSSLKLFPIIKKTGYNINALHFPIGILGQVWYLIVSIPDLCTLTYFDLHS